MAIDSIGPTPNQPQSAGTESKNATNNGNNPVQRLHSTASAATTDSVTLTTQADQLKSIEADISNQPAIDGARVESLKSAIDAGNYKINPLNVAEKFIQFESGFFEDGLTSNMTGSLRP